MNRHARKATTRAGKAAALASLILASSASAQILHWDTNGSTLGIGAAGTWDTTIANWSTDPLGQIATQAWASGNVAQFSAGTTSTGSFTVTVSGTVPGVNGITFEEGVVTLDGTGTLDAGATTMTLQHGNVGSTVLSRTHTINANLAGTSGLTFFTTSAVSTVNNATFIIGGTNNYTGVTRVEGALAVGTNNGGGIIIRPQTADSLGLPGVGNEIFFASSFGDGTRNSSTVNSRLEIAGGQTWLKDLEITGGGSSGVNAGQLSIATGVGTWAGNVVVNGQANNLGSQLASIGAQGTSTLFVTGEIKNVAGSGSTTVGNTFAKVGTGTLVLTGSNPNYFGLNRIFNGVLDIRANGALGAPSIAGSANQGAFMTASTSTFAFTNNVDYTDYKILTIGATGAATGSGGLGAVHGGAGTNRFAGDIRVGGVGGGVDLNIPVRNTFGVATGGTLDLAGKLYASSGSADVSSRQITKIGGGTLVISGENNGTDGVLEDPTAPGSFSFAQFAMKGSFVINEGTLVLRSASGTGGSMKGGEFSASANPGGFDFQVNPAGTFFIDNSLAVNTDRLASTGRVLLTGGNFQFGGNSSTPVTQSISGGVVPASYSTISVLTPGAQATLDLAGVSRDLRGTALIRGADAVNARIVSGGDFGTNVGGGGGAGSPSVGIVAALVGDASVSGTGTDLVTNDPTGGLRPLTASEYTPLVSGSAALENTTASGAVSISADTTVNSIKMAGNTDLAIGAANTLNVNSGGILVLDGAGAGTSTLSGGALAFGGREGVFHILGDDTLNLSANISGGDGITKSGTGNMLLSGTNTYTGPTSVNSGVLQVNSFASMGNNGDLNLNGGTLRILNSDTFSAARTVFIGNIAGGTMEVATGATVNLVSNVTGQGTFTKSGDGTLVLSNFNSLSGALRATAGTISASAPDNLGTGQVILQNATLLETTAFEFTRQISLQGTNNTVSLPAGSTGTFSGGVTGPANLTIIGGGTLSMAGAAPLAAQTNSGHTGNYIVTGGSTIQYPSAANNVGLGTPVGTQAGYWTLDNGQLAFLNSIAAVGTTVFTVTPASTRGLTVNAGGGKVFVDSNGSINFSAAIVSGPGKLTKTGLGTLTMSATHTFSGGLQIDAGLVRANNNGLGNASHTITFNGGSLLSIGVINGTRPVSVTAPTAVFDSSTFASSFGQISGPGNTFQKLGAAAMTSTSIRVKTLDVVAGNVIHANGPTPADATTASVLGSTSTDGVLTLAAGSSLDVGNNALIVHYSGASNRAALEALVATGFAGGSWNGVGINSAAAAANAGNAVGIAEASDIGSPATFAGQPIDGTTTLIRYTRVGDADLSGTTDIGDFSLLAANFNVVGTRWNTGDFNYDGITDIGDFSLLAANFNASATGDLPRGAAVPEPASLSLIGLGVAGLAARRRR